MSEVEDLYIRMMILKVLDLCCGYRLRRTSLNNQLNIILDGLTQTAEELAAQLEYLRGQGLVEFFTPLVGGPPKWSITDTGKKAFREWQYN